MCYTVRMPSYLLVCIMSSWAFKPFGIKIMFCSVPSRSLTLHVYRSLIRGLTSDAHNCIYLIIKLLDLTVILLKKSVSIRLHKSLCLSENCIKVIEKQ